ncbi:phage portal protein [Nocardia sp. NPDC051463]|uniref:phage portal protein n=1 Tax=Nocardia sp. NPDC051463 TaxID=3154845 RepID=UPI00344CF8AB
MEGKDQIGSDAWWFEQLMAGFDARVPDQWRPVGMDPEPTAYETRRDRLERLWSYHVGRAPLPQVAVEYTEIFRAVMRKARCNYAGMAVNAMLDRMALAGVSTATDNDVGGDDLAAEISEVSNLPTTMKDLFAYLFVMGESYGMVIPAKPGSDARPMISALDPRNCIGDPDPDNPTICRAVVVRTCDPIMKVERAILFLPGRKRVAARSLASAYSVNMLKWEWEGEPEKVEGIDQLGGIPIVRFDNAYGMGEFEGHVDLLDRINDTTLQRIVVTWYQSFRQRGVIGDLEGDTDDDSDDAEPMTLEEFQDIFRADPGAMWRVPAGVQFWESGQADLGPIINAKRDDVKEFAAVTSTPLHLITPDSANQSAEGASLMREGHTAKVRDRRERVQPRVKLLLRMAFALAGDPRRGNKIQIQWGSLQDNSLADQGSATAQARGVLSLRNILVNIWGMTPTEAEQNITELTAEQLLALATTATQPPANTTQPMPNSTQPVSA